MAIRLVQVAKELNVGVQTIVDHLKEKGIVVENKPTSKIEEDVYNVLLSDFNKDKALKAKSDKIDIGKITKDTAKIEIRKPEPELIKAKKVEIEGPKIVGKVEKAKPKVVEIKIEEPQKTTEVIKAKKVEVEGPKVIGKVEEEKPKKTTKKKEETQQPELFQEKVSETSTQSEPAEAKDEIVYISADPEKNYEDSDVIKAQLQTIAGPTIVSAQKIDLEALKAPKKSAFTAKHNEKTDQSADKKHRQRKVVGAQKIDPTKVAKDNKDVKRDDRNKTGRTDNRNNRFGNNKPDQPKEISEKEIQEKIKQTLTKINTSQKVGRDKQLKSKIKERNQERLQRQQDESEIDSSIIEVTEFLSVSDLASLMNVSPTQIISTCMNVGVFVSINQRLEADVIELVASEFGYTVKFITAEDQVDEEEVVDLPEDLLPRAPIVTVMGHVDHGKTSLLDYIRKANVVAGEAGGITQHIGAYEVVVQGKKITFLDTPGHEAFTAMRARGAKVTDIAVIIIAADDAVMPQTREAIAHAQAAGVPMVFAINKVDKEGANPDRIYEQLSAMNILVESWGGKFQNQEIAAKKGMNVDKLLEKILLEAELLDLKANPEKNAVATVIEASLEKGKGYVAKILVQEGSLEIGDPMVAGSNYGRCKAMLNEHGDRVTKAGPSTPVLILGLDGAPQAGEKLRVYDDESEAKEIAAKRNQILREQGIRTKKHITLDEIGRRLALGNFKQLNIIVKGDYDGSIEALSDALLKQSTEEIQVNIVHKGVGQISDSDVMLASASDAIIVAFQVRPSNSARILAEREGVEIRTYSIIYQAIEEIKQAMEGLLEPTQEEKIVCNIEIRDVFNISKVGTIAGCYVLDGKVTRQTQVRIIREGIVIHTGALGSLKRFKDDVKEVTKGYECGLNIDKFNDIQVGDLIEGFEMVEVKRKL